MANLKSSIKRIKTNARNRARNLGYKSKIKKLERAAEKAITAKAADAKDKVKAAIIVIDKAAQHGVLHKNTAGRKKSKLMRRLNKK